MENSRLSKSWVVYISSQNVQILNFKRKDISEITYLKIKKGTRIEKQKRRKKGF